MARIAITGGIASGKSLFASALARLGMEILDADDVTHRLEAPGGKSVPELVRGFGREILSEDGGIDRGKLGKRVFASVAERERLNLILHPLVRAEIETWMAKPGRSVKAVVIPLLYECGWAEDWEVVICLVSSEETQIRRMVCTRGYSEEEARRRIASQMPAAEKAARAQMVVQNDGDEAALLREADRVFAELISRYGR